MRPNAFETGITRRRIVRFLAWSRVQHPVMKNEVVERFESLVVFELRVPSQIEVNLHAQRTI